MRTFSIFSTTEKEFQYEIDMQSVAYAFSKCANEDKRFQNTRLLHIPKVAVPEIKHSTIIQTSGQRKVGFIHMQRITNDAVSAAVLLCEDSRTLESKKKICDAIGAALSIWHQGAIAHGDFHAHNIMVNLKSSPCTVFFLDFANSCTLGQLDEGDQFSVLKYDICRFIRSIRESQSKKDMFAQQCALAFLNAYDQYACKVKKCQPTSYSSADEAVQKWIGSSGKTHFKDITTTLVHRLSNNYHRNILRFVMDRHGIPS
jgi:tRNA A-37 threonylcarbamoyl transferase component Bud32